MLFFGITRLKHDVYVPKHTHLGAASNSKAKAETIRFILSLLLWLRNSTQIVLGSDLFLKHGSQVWILVEIVTQLLNALCNIFPINLIP